jgi:hypothetical protein
MLKTRFIKLLTTTLADGRFCLTAEDEYGNDMSRPRGRRTKAVVSGTVRGQIRSFSTVGGQLRGLRPFT